MEERHNPNCLKCLRHTTKSWSELPLDLLISVFERLSFANFKRAKSVCSSWHSASRQSVSKILPWLILFPRKNNNNNSCMLFNPDEKEKLYKTGDLGVDFAKSVCKARYGSWFLMQDPRYNLYILNIFTCERINLPPVESQLGMTKIERTIDDRFLVSTGRTYYKGVGMPMRSPVIWIDEKTKDYVVICGLGRWCVAYAKKGDKCWNQIPELVDCLHMVYKDHKLYFSSNKSDFRIFDFSREIRQQNFQDCVIMHGHGLILKSSRAQPDSPYSTIKTKFVVTVTGDVLKVDRVWNHNTRICKFFEVYKVYSSGFFQEYERVGSLGDEAIIWDLGISVHANDIGLQRIPSISVVVMERSLTIHLSSISRQIRWILCTNLSVRYFNSLLLDGSVCWFFSDDDVFFF